MSLTLTQLLQVAANTIAFLFILRRQIIDFVLNITISIYDDEYKFVNKLMGRNPLIMKYVLDRFCPGPKEC